MIHRPLRWRACVSTAVVILTCLWGGAGHARPLAAQQPGTTTAPPPAPLALRGVTVIDVTTGRHLSNQTVVVIGSRIRAVGPERTTPVPRGAQIVNARGKYVIPGLWDMHIHVRPSENRVLAFENMVRAGITGFRNAAVGGWLAEFLQERQAILTGLAIGPPREIFGADVQGGDGMETPLDTAAFDSLKQAGADLFKMWQMPRAKYFQFARQARRVGLTFGGHIGAASGHYGAGLSNPDSSSVTAEEISDSGATIIDHVGLSVSGGLDTLCVPNAQPEYRQASVAACRRAADHLRRNNTWWVPTLAELIQVGRRVLFDLQPQSKALWASYKQGVCDADVRPDSSGILSIAARAGMPLLAGTDVGAVGGAPESLIHLELALMVSEGVPPLAALQAATVNPARWLHATDSLGTVAPGKLADLVVLDDDPLVRITNTTHVWAVVANGRYLKGRRPCR